MIVKISLATGIAKRLKNATEQILKDFRDQELFL